MDCSSCGSSQIIPLRGLPNCQRVRLRGKAAALLSGHFPTSAVDVFHALAEPHRRKVVEILAHRGRLNATQICDEFDVTPQAISQHLRVLREADVIQMERRAQRRLYELNTQPLWEVERWAANITKMWNSRLNRLDEALKDAAASGIGGAK